MKGITLAITSCNRFHLLERTLDSFLALNQYPISKYILNEDSGNKEVIKKIIDKYGDLVHIIRSPKNEGLLKSIDNLYSLVDTDMVFQCEDDWLFRGDNRYFIDQSVDILERREDIHQVWIRKGIPESWIESEDLGLFRMVKQNHLADWSGFSFNPSCRRVQDYKRMFPNGYNEYNIGNAVQSEHRCNQIANTFGYRAAILNSPVAEHIGDGQTTY